MTEDTGIQRPDGLIPTGTFNTMAAPEAHGLKPYTTPDGRTLLITAIEEQIGENPVKELIEENFPGADTPLQMRIVEQLEKFRNEALTTLSDRLHGELIRGGLSEEKALELSNNILVQANAQFLQDNPVPPYNSDEIEDFITAYTVDNFSTITEALKPPEPEQEASSGFSFMKLF